MRSRNITALCPVPQLLRLWASGLCDMPNGFPFLASYRANVSLIVNLKDPCALAATPLLSLKAYIFPPSQSPVLERTEIHSPQTDRCIVSLYRPALLPAPLNPYDHSCIAFSATRSNQTLASPIPEVQSRIPGMLNNGPPTPRPVDSISCILSVGT